MATIIVVYESRYGQTQKVADHIADRARREGHDARTLHASLATTDRLDRADAFVVVAPVYFGQHPRALRAFLRTYGAILEAHPLAFVSVSNSAAAPSIEARSAAMRLARRTMHDAALRPCVVACTGGAIAYPRYGVLVRAMMKLIARREDRPTDTTRVFELTNWAALDRDLAPFFASSEIEPPPDPKPLHVSEGQEPALA